MIEITDKQLLLNQKFCDLVYDYHDDNEHDYYMDAKALMKYMWNKGYVLTERTPPTQL